MTRRAFRPMTSAAGAAPVISKLDGLPCGAFGSITVLISSFLPFPRSWGARGDVLTGRKNCGANCAPSLCVSGTSRLVWPGGEKVRAQAGALTSPGAQDRLVPNGAKNTPVRFACQEYSTRYWASLFDCSQ